MEFQGRWGRPITWKGGGLGSWIAESCEEERTAQRLRLCCLEKYLLQTTGMSWAVVSPEGELSDYVMSRVGLWRSPHQCTRDAWEVSGGDGEVHLAESK